MAADQITIMLTKEEAIVLFEFLSRAEETDKLHFANEAEERVLWSIHAVLEKNLVEPFHPDWNEILEQARAKVRSG
jgi:hypothetical protein